jgi:hypothetical protein
VNADNSNSDTIMLGIGAGGTVSAQSSINDTITLGDGNNDSVNADHSTNGTITLGNGDGDSVSAVGTSGVLGSPYHITLGDGISDKVIADGSSFDTIKLGIGAGDSVRIAGSVSHDVITLGDGAGDKVSTSAFTAVINSSVITLGNGANDQVLANVGSDDVITVGDGAKDLVEFGLGLSGASTITLGNGANDSVTGESPFGSGTAISTITLGDGNADSVSFSGDASTAINLGKGAGDTVTVFCNFLPTPLPVTISTITVGDGDKDNVTVTSHTPIPFGAPVAAIISVGNGNNDVVDVTTTEGSTIKVGNGDDTIYLGTSSIVTVGTGQDSFVFDPFHAGNFEAGTVSFHDGTEIINKFNVASPTDTIDFSAIDGLNDHAVPVVTINFLTSTPTTIAPHTIDVVKGSSDTSIYANESTQDETIGSPAIGTQDIHITLTGVTTALTSSNFILH